MCDMMVDTRGGCEKWNLTKTALKEELRQRGRIL